MGDKMKKLILALILAPTLAIGQTASYTVRSTSDSDGVKVNRHTAAVAKDWGVGVINTEYHTPLYSKNSNGLVLIADHKKDNITLIGNIGLGSVGSKNYLLGDITGTMYVNKYISLNITAFGDLIDSTNSLSNNITARGLVIGSDFNYGNVGLAAGSRQIWYSNDNKQTGYYIKPYYSIIDGVNVYLTKRNYSNSNPYNGLYFSPEDYDRSGFGVSIRQRIQSITVSAFVDRTSIKTPFSDDKTTAWKLEAMAPIGSKSKANVSFGRDYNNGFSYRYLQVGINHAF